MFIPAAVLPMLSVIMYQDETYYDAYNNRFGELHGPITFEPYRQAATDFKHTILYKHIAGEQGEGGCEECCVWGQEGGREGAGDKGWALKHSRPSTQHRPGPVWNREGGGEGGPSKGL